MKHYTHKPVELKKLTTQTINFKRFYETPDGNLYPSITTVLSTRNKKGLFEWRKKVGDEVANYVARVSANRGTAVHHMCEDYLNNYPIDWPDKWKEHEKKFLPYCLFKQLKKTVLEKIDNNAKFMNNLLTTDFIKLGMKTIIYKHLHMQRCLKNKLEHLSNRLLFWS